MPALALQVYRLLLRLLPPEFRARCGLELEELFVACVVREYRRRGRWGAFRAVVAAFADVVGTAVLLRTGDGRGRSNLPNPYPEIRNGDSMMARIWQDLRYAARGLRRAPGFSAIVVVTLALAIGVNTAIFSIVDAVLLRALPFPNADRLVLVYEAIPKAISGPIGFSAPDFKAFETRVTSFEGMAAFANREFELSGVDHPERISAARVSAALFEVLGVAPMLGRTFTREEDEARVPVVALSDRLWRRKFGADPAIVGRAITLDRRAYTVVAVMPSGFVFPNRGPARNSVPADLYVPISFTAGELNGFASMYNNSVVARLKPGVDVGQADAEVRAVASRLVQEIYPAPLRDGGFGVSASAVPLHDETVGGVSTVLYVLLAAVATVLLIACADMASLMLTRAAARGREMAVRVALGARRSALFRQVLLESTVLAACGGVLGVLCAYSSTGALVSLAPSTLPRLHEVAVDIRVLAFATVLSSLAAVLCGVIPAIELSRNPSGEALKDGGRGATYGLYRRRVFGALVMAQFALAVVLLVCGGLLVRSLDRLMAVDPGFRTERTLTLSTTLPAAAYPRAADVRGFYQRLTDRLAALPGVTAVATATALPLSTPERRAFVIERQPESSRHVPHVIAHDWVGGRYFEAFGIPLRDGRGLGPEDSATSEPVVVINETMARTFWPGATPIGQRIAWGGVNDHGPWMRIVGIVADVKQGPLNTETVAQTYIPSTQVSDRLVADNVWGGFRAQKVIVRGQTDPASLASALSAQVRQIDPSLPVARVRTMDDVVRESAGPQRFNAVLLGSFAVAALILAALGIGGVLATSVTQRRQELGIRMALGAQRAELVRMVIREGMTLAVAGLVVGLPAAFAATRVMSSLLFGVSPRDPATFVLVTAVLVGVALAACYLPARRATRIDPIVALRYE